MYIHGVIFGVNDILVAVCPAVTAGGIACELEICALGSTGVDCATIASREGCGKGSAHQEQKNEELNHDDIREGYVGEWFEIEKKKLRGETGRDVDIYDFQSMSKRKGGASKEPKNSFFEPFDERKLF